MLYIFLHAKMTSKEKKVWSNILEVYRKSPHLWDKHNKNYMNRNMRDEGFRLLLEIYKELDENGTVNILKKKLENMRTCFTRELKKIKASTQTGIGTDRLYVPSLWYFNLLSFLEESSEPSREATDTLNKVTDTQRSGKGMDDGTVLPKRKRPRTNILKKQKLMNSAHKLLNTQEEECEIMGKSIAIQLKDLNKEQLTIVNKIISDAIFYAKTGKLTTESSIDLGTSNQHTAKPHSQLISRRSSSQYTAQNHHPLIVRRGQRQIQPPSTLSYYGSSSVASIHLPSPQFSEDADLSSDS